MNQKTDGLKPSIMAVTTFVRFERGPSLAKSLKMAQRHAALYELLLDAGATESELAAAGQELYERFDHTAPPESWFKEITETVTKSPVITTERTR